MDHLPVMQKIVAALGDAGYSAVDFENEIDMENPEPVRVFCEKAREKQEAEVTILSVLDNGGFTRYDLRTAGGNLNVTRCMLQWQEAAPKAENVAVFEACSWCYTEKGYLFFEEYRPAGYDGPGGHVAIRVNPLDETCRELNRKYLEPVGYGQNNLFLTDWTEEDYGELNFYDMFDVLYTAKYGEDAYYHFSNVGGRNPDRQQGGEEYEISEQEFEDVIFSYFSIDSTMLRERTAYRGQTGTYRYRPRSVYDCGTGSIPFPEVVDYVENEDGTLTLTVEAVWMEEKNDRALTHEVVVRPLADGTFQYVSNRMIQTEASVTPTWYRSRLTDEEWEEHYGTPVFTDDVYTEMKNYEKMEAFFADAAAGKACDVTAYQQHEDGGITKYWYVFDGEDMYVYITINTWNEKKKKYTANETIAKIKEWEYTEKGWFCYEMCVPEPPEVTEVMNGKVMIRVKPMQEEYREFAVRYLLPVGYKGNNLFRLEWNTEELENLDYTGLYEYLFTLEYQEAFDWKQYQDGIPAEEFETLMTAYLPVSTGQLRQWAAFDEEKQVYPWIRLGCGNYAPNKLGTSIPEVTDIRENADGTVTVTVDAVCELAGNEAVFTHQVTARITEEGRIQFLGNHIAAGEEQKLPDYQYRLGR